MIFWGENLHPQPNIFDGNFKLMEIWPIFLENEKTIHVLLALS